MKQRLAKRRNWYSENCEYWNKTYPGYYVQYGGQFENLQSAKARLMCCSPLALFLILILLYFAFDQ
jgi:Cu/Ag efflux pump CusA